MPQVDLAENGKVIPRGVLRDALVEHTGFKSGCVIELANDKASYVGKHALHSEMGKRLVNLLQNARSCFNFLKKEDGIFERGPETVCPQGCEGSARLPPIKRPCARPERSQRLPFCFSRARAMSSREKSIVRSPGGRRGLRRCRIQEYVLKLAVTIRKHRRILAKAIQERRAVKREKGRCGSACRLDLR